MENIIKEIISNVTKFDVASINNSDLLPAIGIDSLNIVEVLVNVEERFNIVIDDSALNPDTLTNVQSIIDLVTK